MNLHIAPDNVFTNKFYENLKEVNALDNNHIIVRTRGTSLKHIKHNIPFAAFGRSSFNELVKDTAGYEKVFIHQFTPLLYRWVAENDFHELNWMVWGADLYNLPSVNIGLYEPLTSKYVTGSFSLQRILYRLKVMALQERYRDRAYEKVANVLTWMEIEYEFARKHLSALKANHRFFFYENQLPYQALDDLPRFAKQPSSNYTPTFFLGNSATPELNHLDAIYWLHRNNVRANLRIPVSYGDPKYTAYLMKNVSFYKGGDIEFIDRYMRIEEYLAMLNASDGLIMNNIRPQGFGNILMMMYLGKKVILNERNLCAAELTRRGLQWFPLSAIQELVPFQPDESNKQAVLNLLSHESLLRVYQELFS